MRLRRESTSHLPLSGKVKLTDFPLAVYESQLASFLSSNPSSCHPTWILTGTLLPSPSDAMDVDEQDASQDAKEEEGGAKAVRLGVLMCTQEDLDGELRPSFLLPSLRSFAPARSSR